MHLTTPDSTWSRLHPSTTMIIPPTEALKSDRLSTSIEVKQFFKDFEMPIEIMITPGQATFKSQPTVRKRSKSSPTFPLTSVVYDGIHRISGRGEHRDGVTPKKSTFYADYFRIPADRDVAIGAALSPAKDFKSGRDSNDPPVMKDPQHGEPLMQRKRAPHSILPTNKTVWRAKHGLPSKTSRRIGYGADGDGKRCRLECWNRNSRGSR